MVLGSRLLTGLGPIDVDEVGTWFWGRLQSGRQQVSTRKSSLIGHARTLAQARDGFSNSPSTRDLELLPRTHQKVLNLGF